MGTPTSCAPETRQSASTKSGCHLMAPSILAPTSSLSTRSSPRGRKTSWCTSTRHCLLSSMRMLGCTAGEADSVQDTLYESVHSLAFVHLESCVLVDKYRRLRFNINGMLERQGEEGAVEQLQTLVERELLSPRERLREMCPSWVVFEAEARLQVRESQLALFSQLIETKGMQEESAGNPHVCQLNVGEGKTRVVIPMLVLFYLSRPCLRVPVVHVLQSLRSESVRFFRSALSSSALGVSVLDFPFNRDVEVEEDRPGFTRSMAQFFHRTNAARCRDTMLLCPRESTWSWLLKEHEVEGDGSWCRRKVVPSNVLNIFDEADELFSPRLQMMYAVGQKAVLEGMEHRQLVMTQVFLALSDFLAESEEHLLRPLLSSTPRIDEIRACHRRCNFPSRAAHLRSESEAEVPEELMRARSCLRQDLVRRLVRNKHMAPQLDWFTDARERMTADEWQEFESFATDPACDREPCTEFMTRNRKQMLAIRAVLVVVLEHCLQQRLSVRYGLRKPRQRALSGCSASADKRIAVPFDAADQPSLRSEFEDPDVAMVLTYLAYFDKGVSLEQLREVLLALESVSDQRRSSEFDRWVNSLDSAAVLPDDFPRSWAAVDPRSSGQVRMLHSELSHNMHVVSCFLCLCVFPLDMQQYARNLSANTWHLAGLPGIGYGFSGTTDNKWLWPRNVRHQPARGLLTASTGKLIERLCMSTRRLHKYDSGELRAGEMWKHVLREAVGSGSLALIDAGALLVGGSSRREVVRWFVEHELCDTLKRSHVEGITYFDNTMGEWAVWAFKSTDPVPLRHSTVAERDTFVIFDEARCRGADMKLRPNMSATLTIAASMHKDKFLQAAGRLRQLGKSRQELRIVGTECVIGDIARANDVAVESLLEEPGAKQLSRLLRWSIVNAVELNEQGMLGFLRQGLSSAGGSSSGSTTRKLCNAPADNELGRFSGSFSRVPIKNVAEAMGNRHAGAEAKEAKELVQYVQQMCGDVETRCQKDLSLECEREVEKEVEIENEVQAEDVYAKPVSEKVDVPVLVRRACIEKLFATDFKGSRDAHMVSERAASSRRNIQFPPTLLATDKFWQTLEIQGGALAIPPEAGLRMVTHVVVLGDGLVLISRSQAEAVARELLPGGAPHMRCFEDLIRELGSKPPPSMQSEEERALFEAVLAGMMIDCRAMFPKAWCATHAVRDSASPWEGLLRYLSTLFDHSTRDVRLFLNTRGTEPRDFEASTLERVYEVLRAVPQLRRRE
eukprot:Hpha_TRINITY_DN15556_c0_g1::TRINITY_DN15556_c0_g1_i1::g.106787::m.106787